MIDDLEGCADVMLEIDAWFHVDGGTGCRRSAAGLRDQFTGLERADSFILDPHKWLFAAGYARCAASRGSHARSHQHGPCVEAAHRRDRTPCDLGYQLTRRAGLRLVCARAAGLDAHRPELIRLATLAAAMADALEAEPRPS